jgi:hypothetical protein
VLSHTSNCIMPAPSYGVLFSQLAACPPSALPTSADGAMTLTTGGNTKQWETGSCFGLGAYKGSR